VMDPAHCWWSWTEQTKSLERLLGHEFQWTLPSHGRWYHSPAADMRRALTIAIARAKAEVV